ncbi:hypothetical protein BH11CYA1_BH11CYA1_32370 [soil metagenome]
MPISCPLLDDVPSTCCKCQAGLCLRQQVLNLALGEDQDLMCLNCLAADNNKSNTELLEGLAAYIANRECFAKPWSRYASVDFCPNPLGCIPEVCFKASK